MKTSGPTAIPIFELPRPREKMGGGGRPVSLAIRKEKRPRKRRKRKTKTKTADVVVKARQQVMHRQEEESRWAAEVQAAEEDKRTQQEEDSRWAAAQRKEETIVPNPCAVKKKEGVYVLDGVGRELGAGVGRHVRNSRFLVLKETYAAFVFDGTGWWDHAYWHDEGLGWYWGMSPSRIMYRDKIVLSENCSEWGGGLL